MLMLIDEEKILESQVTRILNSDEFHGSEVLKRLLKFLVEKSILGEADQLKEYSVAIDGMGKPHTYDPRQNSAVRIQVGRLRQKLGEYYRKEGKDEPYIIDLPRGRFKLSCEPRNKIQDTSVPILSLEESYFEGNTVTTPNSRSSFTWISLFMAVCAVVFALALLTHLQVFAAAPSSDWDSVLHELWAPFVDSKQPCILVIEDPLFVELNSDPGVYYRDKSLNQWKDASKSPAVLMLQSQANHGNIQPSHYYTAYGEVYATFLLGKLFGPRKDNFSIVKASQLTWQQLADNNVIFVGVQNLFFEDQLHGMPFEPQLVPSHSGIVNVHPKAGEPSLFADSYTTSPAQGIVYALVTHLPGPLRNNDIESFTSTRSAGYVGAVQWFTDQTFAQTLTNKLKEQFGEKTPKYYQVLFKVKFSDDVPTEITYVLSRELH
jgi:hypothetical protein